MSTSEAIQMVNQRQAVWVDVRPAEQFQAGHIAQARSVPAADLEQKAGNLPKNKPLIVVCDNGRDSARAAKLRAQGLRRRGAAGRRHARLAGREPAGHAEVIPGPRPALRHTVHDTQERP